MTGLLVSVRDAAEARVALDSGASLIDVKEPAAGPLGRATAEVLAAVLAEVGAARPVSAAMGELADWPPGEAPPAEVVTRLAFVKWGLARAPEDWRQRLRQLRGQIEDSSPCRVVVTAYADALRAGAPRPQEVCHEAVETRARVLMLDTWGKDGTPLLSWLSLAEVRDLREQCHSAGVALALAGALGRSAIRELWSVRPDWFAVRGAVCRLGARGERIEAERVRALVRLVQGDGEAEEQQP